VTLLIQLAATADERFRYKNQRNLLSTLAQFIHESNEIQKFQMSPGLKDCLKVAAIFVLHENLISHRKQQFFRIFSGFSSAHRSKNLKTLPQI